MNCATSRLSTSGGDSPRSGGVMIKSDCFAPFKSTFHALTPYTEQPTRLARTRLARTRLAANSFAPRRSALVKFARLRLAAFSVASRRSAELRLARKSRAPVKLAWRRSAPRTVVGPRADGPGLLAELAGLSGLRPRRGLAVRPLGRPRSRGDRRAQLGKGRTDLVQSFDRLRAFPQYDHAPVRRPDAVAVLKHVSQRCFDPYCY